MVIDASCLIELVTRGVEFERVAAAIDPAEVLVAPHIIDAEVAGIIRRDHQRGLFDRTEARLAIERLQSWPGERFPQTALLDRVWELRDSVRTWDAMYIALAEALGATFVTLDRRLANSVGPRCRIVVP